MWHRIKAAIFVSIASLATIAATSHALSEIRERESIAATSAPEYSLEDQLDGGTHSVADAGPEAVAQDAGAPLSPADEEPTEAKDEKVEKEVDEKIHWRRDPNLPYRSGSYLGGNVGYTMLNARFRPTEEEFNDELSLGPMHGTGLALRVGDSFREWFAVGFQIHLAAGMDGPKKSITAFGLLLDATFYPWRGLGIRPSVGLGVSYATGEEDYQLGYGWPADLSLSITYEFRLARSFTMGPVVQFYWIPGEDYNGLFFFAGVEFSKWFLETPKKEDSRTQER